MQCHSISDFEDDENEPKNINNIINKYESKITTLNINKNKINDIIDKSSDFTSQNSRRTKNSSNFSHKINGQNKIGNIQFLIDDSSKNISSSIGSKSIKSNKNSKKININDIEINIGNINKINHNINKLNNIDVNDEIKKVSTNQNTSNNQKIFEKNNNTSIYETSFNMLFNPFDNNKFFLNKPKNLILLKGNDKEASKIMKNIMNIQEQQLKKENDELKNQIINNKKIENKTNKDKYNNNKHKNYLNNLFKKKKISSKKKISKKTKKKKRKNNNIKINPNSTSNTNINTNKKTNWKKKKCDCSFWLNIIRNIIIFIIISSALTFYSFVFFVNK